MKLCLCCKTKAADEAPTCLRCGEASFAACECFEPADGSEPGCPAHDPEAPAPPTDPSPTDALAEWMAEPQESYADGAYPARHGRCTAPLDLSEDEG